MRVTFASRPRAEDGAGNVAFGAGRRHHRRNDGLPGQSPMSDLWQIVLLGGVALLVILWWGPGAREMLKRSREAENPDWAGALLPIGAVILFVILLIWLS